MPFLKGGRNVVKFSIIFVSPMVTPVSSPKYTRISSMHNLNNDWLITPPRRTPYVFANSSPNLLFHLTWLIAFPKRLRNNWNNFPLKPCISILNKKVFSKSDADLKSTYTETEMSSFWWNFHHWLHWKLSKWQLPVQPVMKISSKWRHFRFSVRDMQGRFFASYFLS